MSEITPVTDQQQLALSVLRMLDGEPSGAKKAIDFIASSQLNLELFRDSYLEQINLSGEAKPSPSSISAMVDVAIASATQKLTIFK